MSDLSPKALKRLLNLHAVAVGSEHASERAKAIEDLITLLKKHDKTGTTLHGAVLAQFMHTALTLSNGRQSECSAKGAGCAAWGDNRQRASPFAPT
jgi:hypothetical protein